MNIVAVMVVQPNQSDQILALPAITTFAEAYAAVKQRLGNMPFRVAALDVGTWETGDNPRPDTPLPASETPFPIANGVLPRLPERSAWLVSIAGQHELFFLGATNLTEDVIHEIIRRDYPGAHKITIRSAELGVYPVRQVIFSSIDDARWVDETGHFQIRVPPLSSPPQTA